MKYLSLQNESDIRGVAISDIEEKINLNKESCGRIGKAFALWLKKRIPGKTLKVAIGMDSRVTGPELTKAITEGLNSQGVIVTHFGLATTPSMFMAVKDKKLSLDGSIMLTASHLPYDRNGMKFFIDDGGLNKSDITEILQIAEAGDFPKPEKNQKNDTLNYIDNYSDDLRNYIRSEIKDPNNFNKPLHGLKIIVDAGNGSGGFFANKVLSDLGADVSGSQFLEPDGYFPNHAPNPEDGEAVNSIKLAVLKERADLGIIFDTDVDRAAIINNDGRIINRNELIALISAIILKEHPGSTIVTDSITSEGLSEFINTDLQGKHYRFKRGYKKVINEAKRLNEMGEECWLAIETSGHAALKENYFLDDGAFLIAKILVQMAKLKNEGKSLISLINKLKVPEEFTEMRFRIKNNDFKQYGETVLKGVEMEANKMDNWFIETENHEGIRVKCKNEDEKGWFLLRLSLHDPVLPLNIESDIIGGVKKIETKILKILQNYQELEMK